MPPGASATARPCNARAASEEPVAITVPAPSLPAGRDLPTLGARARIAAGERVAVRTGCPGRPEEAAVAMSAPANSRPRSEGLIGAASTRTITSSGAGSGTGTSSRDICTVPCAVTSVRSSRPVPGLLVVMTVPFAELDSEAPEQASRASAVPRLAGGGRTWPPR